MAVGAKDTLDIALVKKYSSLRVDNPIVGSSMVDPMKMYDAMNDYATMHKSMLDISLKLRETCLNAITPSIKYNKTKRLSNAPKVA